MKYGLISAVILGCLVGWGWVAVNVFGLGGRDASIQSAQSEGLRACPGLSAIGPDVGPPELSEAVVICAEAGAMEMAVDLFMLMVARAQFDTHRVQDETAHSAIAAISEGTLLATPDLTLQALLQERGEAQDAGETMPICAALWASGIPEHDPTYMIAHGMNAWHESAATPTPGFDPATAWEATLTGHLNCPQPS